MARKTVKVNIPYRKPDDLVALSKGIIEQHEELGDKSPLNQIDLITFKAKTLQAEELRKKYKKFLTEAQTALQGMETILGIAEGQNIGTPGTSLYTISTVRDQLLVTYKGEEEKLGQFGFNVTIDTSSTGGKKSVASS